MDEVGVGDGGELDHVVVFRRSWEVEIYEMVAESHCGGRWGGVGGGGGEVGSLVAAERLTGAEHPEADRALVDSPALGFAGGNLPVGITQLSSLSGVSAASPDLLVAGAVAAEGLVRREHLFACLALEPVSRFR